MDPTKPPSRLKVVLLSLPPRTQAVLDYFFASTGRSSFEPTSDDLADAAIFDVDTLESRQHWEAYRSRTGRPGIAMSIQPQQVPGAVSVRKPITPAALLNAAAELHASRWTPDPAAAPAPTVAPAPVAAPVVAPTAAPVPSPIAAPAPAAEPVQASVPMSPAVPVPPPTAPDAVGVVAAPIDLTPTAPIAAPVAAPVDAPQAAVVPGELPAATPSAAGVEVAPAATHADAVPPAAANPVAVRPAGGLSPVAAPRPAPATRPASPPMAPRVAVSTASTARSEPRTSASRAAPMPAPAGRPGLGGFFKRLFGLAPEAPAAVTMAATATAQAPAARSAPLQPSTASRPAPPAQPGAWTAPSPATGSPAGDADLDDEDDGDDDGGWHETTTGSDATTAARHPYTPGAAKSVLGGSKAARRRGRKVTTRWVDLSPAAPPHADAHADTVVVEAVVVGAPDPAPVAHTSNDTSNDTATNPATDTATDAAAEPLTPPAAATVAVDAAVASLAEAEATVDAAGDDAGADAADAAAPAEAASAEAPRVAASWRVATTPQDLADEALYCGQAEDVDYEVLSRDVSRRYEPSLSLVGALTEAYLVAGKWRVPTQLDCSAGRIVVDTTRNRVHLGFDDQQLPALWTTPIERRRKTQALNRQEQSALDALPPAAWQPLDRLLWRAGLLGAAGRLPEGTDLRAPVYLRHWPNLTRVQRTPHALRIAALWAIRGAGLMETAELLRIPQRHVFAFYNAALAMDLITTDGSQVKRSQRRAGRNRGLLTRLLGWLQH